MKNNLSVIVIVILVGLLGGVSLLIGINNVFQTSLGPVKAQLNHIEATQKIILSKVDASANQFNAFQAKLAARMPSAPPQPPQEDFNKVYDIPIGASPVNGNKNAPITIIDFNDLQCPFCARFYPALKEVLNAYPDKVKVVIKNFPLSFHPNARPAAKVALAANEQGKYYEMADLLMQNGADVSEAKVKDYAKQLNLNYDKLMSDVKNNEAQYEKIIREDLALGQKVEVQGTPTFFINGKKTNARDFNGYKAEIDAILAAK